MAAQASAACAVQIGAAKAQPADEWILVDGMDNVMTRIAKCCSPAKSHSIQGYLTLERVITIHKYGCAYLQKLTPERMVKVRWGNRK